MSRLREVIDNFWQNNTAWMDTLYNFNVRNGVWVVTKFDGYYNVQASYIIYQKSSPSGKLLCTCFEGQYPSCKHRDMLTIAQAHNKVNSGWFLKPARDPNASEAYTWVRPVTSTLR